MTLIQSISGIRGTIGGLPKKNLTPIDVVIFSSAFGVWIKSNSKSKRAKVVIGRDARPTGELISSLVSASLRSLGIEVVDLGLSTTPTVEMAVVWEKADGGIILTASHNPAEWNALKLLNAQGEFISSQYAKELLEIVEKGEFNFSEYNSLGSYSTKDEYIDRHIGAILELPFVQVEKIKDKQFTIVVDAVNSTGGIAIPKLLNNLGVKTIELYCTPNGEFPHNPEPLMEHLTDISNEVKKNKADLGIVVDPDVDRLALVSENGEMFGEEYTLVAIADYLLSKKKGSVVSNISSSRALRDISYKHGVDYFNCAVGEVHVVEKMKEVRAIIGGEGNGGIIYPNLHYGRDALVGIALFLSFLAESNKSCSELKKGYPNYFMSKKKIDLPTQFNMNEILTKLKYKYPKAKFTTIDGIKIDFENEWVHLRQSNTEPILRVYSESKSEEKADYLSQKIIDFFNFHCSNKTG